MLRVIARRVQDATVASSRTFSAQRPASSTGQSTANTDVPGLSRNVVSVPGTRPNASKDKEYKNPEYFCYHVDSFGEAEVELAKFRLPVPSNKRPFDK